MTATILSGCGGYVPKTDLAPDGSNGILAADMSSMGTNAAQGASDDYSKWENQTLGNYNSDIGSYMSNVNSTLAAGNPYQSKSYLQNQNIATSGAMNSADTAAKAKIQDTAARTGTNTAAVAGQIGANALQSQRDLTNYNAVRDTENEDKWLQEQQALRSQQLAGAQSEAGVFGTETSGRNSANSDLTNIQDSENENWTKLGLGGMSGLGAGLTTAYA